MKNYISQIHMFLLIAPSIVLGYEIETHKSLSEKAFEASAFTTNSSIVTNLGLKPLSDKQEFFNSEGKPKTIVELIKDGANFEDNFPRPPNHFFDPTNGQGLSVKGIVIGNPSPDWALEDKGQIIGGPVLSGQEFSYRKQ